MSDSARKSDRTNVEAISWGRAIAMGPILVWMAFFLFVSGIFGGGSFSMLMGLLVLLISLVCVLTLYGFGHWGLGLVIGAPAVLFVGAVALAAIFGLAAAAVRWIRVSSLPYHTFEQKKFWQGRSDEDQQAGFNREVEIRRRMSVDEGWSFLVSLREAAIGKRRKQERESRDGTSLQRRDDELSILPCCIIRSEAKVKFRMVDVIRIPYEQGGDLELGIGTHLGCLSIVAPNSETRQNDESWAYNGEVRVILSLLSKDGFSIELSGVVYLQKLTDFQRLVSEQSAGKIKLRPWLTAPVCFHRAFSKGCVARGLLMQGCGWDTFDVPINGQIYECYKEHMWWRVDLSVAPCGRKMWVCVSWILSTQLKTDEMRDGEDDEMPAFYFITDIERFMPLVNAKARQLV